tara:strand:+ start:2801 stop:3190 length:390 start_codon:yes stop_codon:yes gene_type:complete
MKKTAIIFLLKGSKERLAPHLNSSEFDCQCTNYGCKRTLVVEKTLFSYTGTRLEFDKPLTIRSGYRCFPHNTEVGGVGDSKHKYGLAIDIAPADVKDLRVLEMIATKHFDVVLKYDDFLHCHNKDGLNG